MGEDGLSTTITDPSAVLAGLSAICAIIAGCLLLKLVARVERQSAKGRSMPLSAATEAFIFLGLACLLGGGGYLLRLF
ncbi:hypothetical protein KFK14_19630 [Sphingobium phenoxybenzoativorans]|uniref:Uncharacterized protein n=1 Tax=Sphingobium phenoxybenzoativorans TaxID=1592790 RepID=A0A975Q0W5_9SPHN|nr:hypothetical protein [Sphingobium phenoxybenzoativorans]QUT05184.1 hypothetical protein KFK14_19630 [Sphingobium phenoxybenzoativorans]